MTAGIARRAAAEVLGPGPDQYWLEAGIAAAVIAAILVGVTMLSPNALEYVSSWWARRIMPPAVAMAPSHAAIATAPSGTDTVGIVAPKPHPPLRALLDERTKSRDAAFTSLFAMWGKDYGAQPGEAGCDVARRAGLRCLIKSGTWKVLRRIDLPAMLTLTTPSGEMHYATLTALDEYTASLDVAGEAVTLPLSEVEPLWDGAFLTLWRAPGLASTDLQPGMASRDVAWLRQHLTDGSSTAAQPTVYDDELKQRVVAFQRANGLTPDGIVGDETLLRIAAMAPDARMPSLSKERP